MSTFTGFSEEDLKRIKTGAKNDSQVSSTNVRKVDKLGAKFSRTRSQYKPPTLQTQNSDEALDSVIFDKCRLSIATPTSPIDFLNNNKNDDENNIINDLNDAIEQININFDANSNYTEGMTEMTMESRKTSVDMKPDIVRGVDNYTEDELAAHRAKLEQLQLQQKLMEEQNKKRKEMLAKALADRTRQTEEEVMRLEKIKKDLQVLDGQFSQDVAVIRKKIDQACLSYAEAEKHYLKVEKEFLQAKINLQKEKEKKELLTEHLCALITHNETRKAQKLELLMLELATDRKNMNGQVSDVALNVNVSSTVINYDDDAQKVIIDGVDQRTGKMVEMNDS